MKLYTYIDQFKVLASEVEETSNKTRNLDRTNKRAAMLNKLERIEADVMRNARQYDRDIRTAKRKAARLAKR